MDFISNQETQFKEMLAAIGIKHIEELFQAIPKDLLLASPKNDDGISEYEGIKLMEALASKNSFPHFENYLGAGSYEHHIPALVSFITSKSEFLTSYTPYQAEASQGMLQVTFEFQSAICALTGMDVANASLYDGASACAEAALMALRINNERNKILVMPYLHPHYRAVINQYVAPHNTTIETYKDMIDDTVAAVIVQSPNFLGTMEDVAAISEKAKKSGALTILCANPLVYGLYHSAGELGADIAVGDTQPFGIPMQFGGPYVGYMACKKELVRQMPGRLVGETKDNQGRRGFVLTLQAREQHIRREKATSNICTNQALAALASLVAILWYGKEGIKKLALTNYQRAAYLRDKLIQAGAKPLSQAPFFNEFVVSFKKPIQQVIQNFRQHKIEPGIDLGHYFPNYQNYLLIAVTETKTKTQLDNYVEIAKNNL